MLLDRRALLPALTALTLSTAACGLSSEVDTVFSNGDTSSTAGRAGSSGTAGGSGSSSTAGAAGSTSTNVGGGGTSSTGGSSTGGSAGSSTATNVGGGGTSSTGGSSTGGSGPVAENCLDGVDNDGDGDADCADADCKPDYQCVPAVPGGWQGYVQVQQTDYPTMPAPCAGGGMLDVYFAGPAGPAECNACTCSDLQGASCSPPGLTCWPGSGSCSNVQSNDWTSALADGQCHKPFMLLGFNNALSCELGEPSQLMNKGTCKPSAADFANKNTWTNEVGACGLPAPGGGCGGAQVCVPKADPGAKLCIQKDGDAACPGAMLQQVKAYTSGTDSRSCSDCACGDSNATCMGGSYTVYDVDGCGNGGSDPPIPVDSQTCKNVSVLLDSGSWSMKATLPKPQGSCPASGGAPQGQVDTQGPVTFCCQP